MRVLVSAASEHGSTAEIAEVVGGVLRDRGVEAEVVAPDAVTALSSYDGVVLGSAVYMGHWLPSATALAERIGTDRPAVPVWLFSSGPVGDPSGKFARQMHVDAAELPKVRAATRALDHRIFAGKLDRADVHGLQRMATHLFRGMVGDFRDWASIRDWAASIADQAGGARVA
jgi:menaquinone-dependent protoporphyrinogen oxidase